MRVGRQEDRSTDEKAAELGFPVTETAVTSERQEQGASGVRRVRSSRWWLIAGISAAALTVLTVAGVRLVTRPSGVVDQIVILTVPSGADVTFDSRELGHSPVKLEGVRVGTHFIEIRKDGYEPVIEEQSITEPRTIEIKLKLLHPGEASLLSPHERIEQYKQMSDEAFTRGSYAIPYEGSALYYSNLILDLQDSNEFAREMKERVQRVLHTAARNAASRRDFALAQDIYGALNEYFPEDQPARFASTRLQAQIAARRGELRELLKSADAAFRAGHLAEPGDASAYYYARQALAIDPQNQEARSMLSTIKEKRLSEVEEIIDHDLPAATKALQQLARLFPEDKQLWARASAFEAAHAAKVERENDPEGRREQGLGKYRSGDYSGAIRDLEFAAARGLGTPEVIFALGHSCMKTGHLDRANRYLKSVPPIEPGTRCSAIAALGEIASLRGDINTALERYREARELGGSTIYPIPELDARIEQIERGRREKESEPAPLSITVTHLHGGVFGGSCKGALGVSSTGVRFDGTEHTYAANFVSVGVVVTNSHLEVLFHNKPEKFRASPGDAQRFHNALIRYQTHAANK